jgi:biopolymer transport protein ExbB/TolQ
VATKGLTWLSIIASTSPFIGLFGTVIGILETFSKLSSQASASLNVVAPAISEALVATAAGICVAIFAYSFHLILKRKAYELSSLLDSQSEVIIASL